MASRKNSLGIAQRLFTIWPDGVSRKLLRCSDFSGEPALATINRSKNDTVEVEAKGGFYDYTARYTPGAAQFHSPARVDAMG